MPQPTVSDVHISAALTQIATAYFQDEDSYIADKVFPPVPVQHQTDQYFVWSKADLLRDEAQQRSDATESAGTGVNLTTASYAAKVWGLHQDIGTQIRANADASVELDVVSTRMLMQKMMIRRDRFWATTFFTTSVWATDNTGTSAAGGGSPGGTTPVFWDDDANGDPFTDIATAQTTILTNTGYMPNTLVLGWPVYQALRKHPLIIDRIKYTNPAFAGTVTPALLAQAFDVNRVLVSKAMFNSAAEGVTFAGSLIAGKNALLCYTAPAPGLMVPTAGYTFPWAGFTGINTLGIRVSQVPMNWLGLGTIRNECEMSFDMKAVGTDLGVFFSGITQ